MKLLVILCIGGMILPKQLSGQGMPVYDNTNFLTLGKQLIESGKQTSQLIQTVNFLKEQKQRLNQVNNVLRDLKLIKEIIEEHKAFHSDMQKDFKDIMVSKQLTAAEIKSLSVFLKAGLEQSMDDLDLIGQVLSNGHFKMSDKERFDLLERRRLKMRQVETTSRAHIQRYKAMKDFRAMMGMTKLKAEM